MWAIGLMASREAEREADRQAQVTSLDRLAIAAALLAWASLDTETLQVSFVTGVLPELITTLTSAQAQAASLAADYIEESLVAQGAEPMGKIIIPQSFAGVSASGRELPGLLVQPLVRVMAGMSAGVSTPRAMASGADLLDSIMTTEIHDAARSAEFTSIAANAEAAGYDRVVEAGACSRCIVLAGRFYRWNAGFRRHPRCRCHHAVRMHATEPQSSQEIFDSMSAKAQSRTFTNAGAASIRHGADIAQVVNARLGMTTATVGGQKVATTTYGAGKRSYTGSIRREISRQRGDGRLVRAPRLMPEEIIRQSNGDRGLARRLLISNGYIVGNIKTLAAEVLTQSR